MVTMKTMMFGAAAMAVVGLAAGAAAAQPMDSGTFIKKAVAGDTAEIQMGRMLEQKGGTPQVRRFGAMLIRDHSLSRQKAEAVARKLNVEAPEQPDPDAVQAMDALKGMSGPAFDRTAKQDAVEDHKKDIAMFEQEANDGSGPAVTHARMTLPTLRKHLAAAEALHG
jgi:putative membrane protein